MTNAIVKEIPEFLATGPHPDAADAMQLYGQFVGSWDQEVTWFERDGTSRRLRGEWHFGWILGGRGIADVWMVPTRPELDAGAELAGYGVTVFRSCSTDSSPPRSSIAATSSTMPWFASRPPSESGTLRSSEAPFVTGTSPRLRATTSSRRTSA